MAYWVTAVAKFTEACNSHWVLISVSLINIGKMIAEFQI